MKIVDNIGNGYNFKTVGDTIVLNKHNVGKDAEYIDIVNEDFDAAAGSDGYYVISDCDGKGSGICTFAERDDNERVFKQNLMPIFGVKNKHGTYLIIADGFKFEFGVVFGVKDGKYYIKARFFTNKNEPYENISLKIVKLNPDDGYSEMAVYYRNYRLCRGECLPLADKMKQRNELRYCADAPEVRIRLGWKPAPPKILEQTVENEPEMYVACTFSDVKRLLEEMKRQGIDKAQICLCGWNKSGHDGRYPDIFPVEEKLGGEDELKNLIGYAEQIGYMIVCHTNSTDCYSISERFKDGITAEDINGNPSVNEVPWSGGRMYNLCPVKALEYAKQDLPRVRDLGFRGLHYIDVMTVTGLRSCYSKKHPSNSKETCEIYSAIMQMCHELFGGFASEGGFDFAAKYLDYGLYIEWCKVDDEMIDYGIPLWEIVYHGIILYNPSTETVNYVIKPKKNKLHLYEYGGKPTFYFYSKFMNGGKHDNWLGETDLRFDNEEEMKRNVSLIKEAYDEYKKFSRLQTLFIIKHKKFKEGVYHITYSDGTVMCIDYNNEIITINE